jgi:hypothetical protein
MDRKDSGIRPLMRARKRAETSAPVEVRLDRLLGRRVVTRNNKPAGRLEEFRAERFDGSWVLTEYVLGRAGLFERLHLSVRLLFGGKRKGYVLRWDQLDISSPEQPRLLCSVAELREL